jgi:putative tricarboxylic transport membrane protein
VVPVLIGAFGIPQIIQVLKDRFQIGEAQKLQRIIPEIGTVVRNIPAITRSALIGVGIGAVPGIGEDIAGWVSYGTAKNTSKHPETFGKGELKGVLASETANNACVGGAMIPLLNLGIPGSPPAAMLLGALMLHGVTPGPMITFEHPTFIIEVAAILLLASMAMWCRRHAAGQAGGQGAAHPPQLFMPIIGVLCIIGSYSLGLNIFNLYLMLPVGIICYFLTEMGYPIAPLVIGVILGPMADENLRRALMVSQGSFHAGLHAAGLPDPVSSSSSGPSSASSSGSASTRTGPLPGSFHGATPAKPYSMKTAKTNKHLNNRGGQRPSGRFHHAENGHHYRFSVQNQGPVPRIQRPFGAG